AGHVTGVQTCALPISPGVFVDQHLMRRGIRPTGLIYPAMDTGYLTVRPNSTAHEVLVDKNTGRARGVAFLDSVTRKSYEAKGKVVILAASTLESARLLLLSRSPQHPNGLGNSSGHV